MPSPLRILSVEDDPNDTMLIQELLEAEGMACELTRVEPLSVGPLA
jgi:CheY-like chemotaxis protein